MLSALPLRPENLDTKRTVKIRFPDTAPPPMAGAARMALLGISLLLIWSPPLGTPPLPDNMV